MSSQNLERLELLSIHIPGILKKECDLLFHPNQYLNESGETLQVHEPFFQSDLTNNTAIHKTL